MAKLVKQRYKTLGDTVGINCYKVSIKKVTIQEAGIDPEKEIDVYAEKNKIIIKNKE